MCPDFADSLLHEMVSPTGPYPLFPQRRLPRVVQQMVAEWLTNLRYNLQTRRAGEDTCVSPAPGASARVPTAPWSVGALGGSSCWCSSIPLISRKAAWEPAPATHSQKLLEAPGRPGSQAHISNTSDTLRTSIQKGSLSPITFPPRHPLSLLTYFPNQLRKGLCLADSRGLCKRGS